MDAEDYVHRIGRTARASSTGVAITFINEKDQQWFGKIEQLIEMEVQKVDTPEDIGKSTKYQPNRRHHSGKNITEKKEISKIGAHEISAKLFMLYNLYLPCIIIGFQ